MEADGPIKSKYSKMTTNRDPFLYRARRASELTLPFLYPAEGSTGSTWFPTPYQSVGARGVSNLAAKLLLALLPPGDSFVRLVMDKKVEVELSDDKEAHSKITKALAEVERSIMQYIENSPIRVSTFEALKHLLVSGNCLVYVPETKKERADMRVFSLDKFVVKRSPRGHVLEIIIEEPVSPAMLPEKVREACECAKDPEQKDSQTKNLNLYTRIAWDNDKTEWTVEQELNGKTVPDSDGTYPKDKLPFFTLRLHKVDGEDYGRGLVEEYLGDLISLESLMKSIVKGSAAAAKVVFLKKPNSVTKTKDVTKAESGDFITGDGNDIDTLQLDKFNDFRVALETIERIETRLTAAFMLRESVQRDAERVTATEIQFMATELDDALGGVYSILAQEYQLPLVVRVMHDMTKKGVMPALPKDVVKPIIITGLDALGRTNELRKLDNLVANIFQLDPQIAQTYVNMSDYMRRRGASLSVDTDGLIRSEEDVKQIREDAKQQAMQDKLIDKGTGPAVKGMVDAAQNQGGS